MDHKLPLGTLRHCIKAMDVAMSDLREAAVDDDLDEATSARLESFAEKLGNVGAEIINLISDEMDEESFMAEEIPDIEELQDEEDPDIMDQDLISD